MKEFRLLRITGIIASIAGVLFILFGGIKTPANFRILSDFIQNLLIINIVLLAFMPKEKAMKIALCVGLFVMGLDFGLETLAIYLNWWYPLGGFQWPPILVVPLEMVVSFIIIGTSMAIVLTFPEVIRETDEPVIKWFKPLFKDKKFDLLWRILLLLINAIIGTHGDYTAGPTIWVPGPLWHPIFTFLMWFGGGMLTLLVFYGVRKLFNYEDED